MNAIIFLAPISCFDQVLQEDPTVNRLVCLISFPPVVPSSGVTGGLLPSLEVNCVQSVVEEDGPRTFPKQVRHPSCEACVRHSISRFHRQLREPTE